MENREHSAIIAIPCLNEAGHIEQVLDFFLTSTSLDLWVLDGGSVDSTVDIVEDKYLENRRVRLIRNPEKLQASAVNLAARHAQEEGYEILLRIDAHAIYTGDFADRVIKTLVEEGASSVVVQMETIGGNSFQDACADLFNSPLGAGNSAHRLGGKRGEVDHGHHAAFLISDFLSTGGGYDASFKANEDAEFDIRLRADNKKIFFENCAKVGYIPRPSVRQLMRQYFRNGYYRSQTFQKHQISPSTRQLLPTVVSATNIASAVLMFFFPVLAFLPAIYAILILTAALKFTTKLQLNHISLIFLAAIVTHQSFGIGMMLGYAKGYNRAQ